MIDIVVPYYNDNDEKWKKVFRSYLDKEQTDDRQVKGDERYREWDAFKYWFRGVEKNCPWVNKVFLLVACESQVPKWLDTTNPKLRIIYHRDYIPEELLPTFNTMTIENYINRIEDLSDNYIYCNDDYYFINPISQSMFFVDDYPVYQNTAVKLEKLTGWYLEGTDATFYKILNHGMDLQKEICGDKAHWYTLDHLPVSHKKSFEKEIMDKYFDKFIEAGSMFRNEKNYSNHVFVCLYKDLKPYYKFDVYGNSAYVGLKSQINFDEFNDKQMVCFNDTEGLDDYEVTKEKLINFLDKKLPDKSSFEK